jgi:hypothetical protein
MLTAMDLASLREKAALCLRIARGLSWNNPGRSELTDLAERFERQAEEIDPPNREKDGSDMPKSVSRTPICTNKNAH